MDNVIISVSALAAQRKRVNPISNDLADISTNRTPEEGAQRPENATDDAIFAGVSMENPFSTMLDKKDQPDAKEAEVMEIMENQSLTSHRSEPANSDTKAQGYVTYPRLNVTEEIADMITVTRAYKANVQPQSNP